MKNMLGNQKPPLKNCDCEGFKSILDIPITLGKIMKYCPCCGKKLETIPPWEEV